MLKITSLNSIEQINYLSRFFTPINRDKTKRVEEDIRKIGVRLYRIGLKLKTVAWIMDVHLDTVSYWNKTRE